VPKEINKFVAEGGGLFASDLGPRKTTREVVAVVENFINEHYLLETRYLGRIIAGRYPIIGFVGAGTQGSVYRALQAGTRILCAVNRLHWLNYDYQWHPESLLSATTGFKTVREFMDCPAMPGVGTLGIREYVDKTLAGAETPGETPENILATIDGNLDVIARCLEAIRTGVSEGDLHGELLCTVEDIRAWRELGSYYRCKFQAALDLVRYERTGDPDRKAAAVVRLRDALGYWRTLAAIGASHYLPYRMSRVGMTFGWSYYIDEVENDIRLAEEVVPASDAD